MKDQDSAKTQDHLERLKYEVAEEMGLRKKSKSDEKKKDIKKV